MSAALEVRGLSKALGANLAVAGVGFELHQGERPAMIGPNGAGKTTCFNMPSGQIAPEAGSIRLMGEEITGLPSRRIWRRGVGRTFQITATFASMTVAENVQMAFISHARCALSLWSRATRLYEAEARALLGEVGLAELATRGAGKSATLQSIMGLLAPRAGSVVFEGIETTGEAPFRVCRCGLGYVPEERRILAELTVRENLEVGRRPRRAGALYWDEQRLFALFPTLAEHSTNLGAHLSGGEQQMLSIARTLMGEPALVLLDEPSEGIAPAIVEHLAEAIVTFKREGLTVHAGDFAGLDADPTLRARHPAL